jgi:putative ABC transport system substrate-binding protein
MLLFRHTERRAFIRLFGGAAVAGLIVWPLAARAQQSEMPLVGFLNSTSADTWRELVQAFRDGMSGAGYIEGQNVSVEYRWAEGEIDRLPGLAAELVQRRVVVIVTSGGDISALAAKGATSSVPIVSTFAADPVKSGFVASLNRPDGNITGATLFAYDAAAKRVELLHKLLPKAVAIVMLTNPSDPNIALETDAVQGAAKVLGLQLRCVNVGTESELEAAFERIARERSDAIVVSLDPFFVRRREQLVRLAARHAIPTIFAWRESAAAGGLMSYGTILTDAYRQIGIYAGRILKGAKPADLPVVQPSRFELVINLNTVKALGLDVPDNLLAVADEVIE